MIDDAILFNDWHDRLQFGRIAKRARFSSFAGS